MWEKALKEDVGRVACFTNQYSGVPLYILLHFIFGFPPLKSIVFTRIPNPNQVYHFAPTVNHLHEENPSLCSTLEPLYCSSHAIAVGGIRFINFVDSGYPPCTTNHTLKKKRELSDPKILNKHNHKKHKEGEEDTN